HLALREVGDDDGFGVGAIAVRIADEGRHVEDGPLGLAFRVVLLGADEHIAGEQVLPGSFGVGDDRQVMIIVRADVDVGDELVPGAEVILDPRPEGVEFGGIERLVYRTPVDALFGGGIADDKAIFGGAAGTCAGGDNQSAGVCQFAFATSQSLLDQLGWVKIVKYG